MPSLMAEGGHDQDIGSYWDGCSSSNLQTGSCHALHLQPHLYGQRPDSSVGAGLKHCQHTRIGKQEQT